jgi:hypothetical protein
MGRRTLPRNNYRTSTYLQLPALTANRTTLRFQDNVETVAASSGIAGSAKEVDVSSGLSSTGSFIHYINSTEATVVSEHGAEKLPPENDKTPWGVNRMMALREPAPSLAVIFAEAQAAGSIQWLRWELVDGKQAAVSFSFRLVIDRLLPGEYDFHAKDFESAIYRHGRPNQPGAATNPDHRDCFRDLARDRRGVSRSAAWHFRPRGAPPKKS